MYNVKLRYLYETAVSRCMETSYKAEEGVTYNTILYN